MVDERRGEVARAGLGEKLVERVVQAGDLIAGRPDEELRHSAMGDRRQITSSQARSRTGWPLQGILTRGTNQA